MDCTDVPLDEVELKRGITTRYQVVSMLFKVCDSPQTLISTKVLSEGVSCSGNMVHWEKNTAPIKLGECVPTPEGSIIYYCKVRIENEEL